MAYEFNTNAGETIKRELLVAYLNTGTTSAAVWSPLGKRVEDSSTEYDWGSETKQDILGDVYTTFKKPVITQTFEPCELDAGDAAQAKLFNLAIVEQNYPALAKLDMLIVHYYFEDTTTTGNFFAEHYDGCAIAPSSIGGAGGGNAGMPIDVTYGGKREIGHATIAAQTGAISFTADT